MPGVGNRGSMLGLGGCAGIGPGTMNNEGGTYGNGDTSVSFHRRNILSFLRRNLFVLACRKVAGGLFKEAVARTAVSANLV
jgi:hypothetical protein